ncbi:hypothetical protein F7725_026966, partial [Dissostichus mawsoni]
QVKTNICLTCTGWTQDSTDQGVAEDPDEERVTLNLTPCDPSETTNNWQEAGTTESQVPETSTVQVEVLKAPPLKQCTTKEVGQEAGTTESQVPETSTVQVEVLKTPPREAVHHHR